MVNINSTDLDPATQPITQWFRRVQSGDHDAQARLHDAVYRHLLHFSERTIKRDWVRALAFLVARTSVQSQA